MLGGTSKIKTSNRVDEDICDFGFGLILEATPSIPTTPPRSCV